MTHFSESDSSTPAAVDAGAGVITTNAVETATPVADRFSQMPLPVAHGVRAALRSLRRAG